MTAFVSKRAFRKAARRGDISTLDMFCRQHDEVTEIIEVEAWVENVRGSDPELFEVLETMINENQPYREELPRAFLDVWFREGYASSLTHSSHAIPLSTLSWIVGAQSILAALAPRTLAVLMPPMISSAISHKDYEAVELLLTSHLFVELLTEDERESVLRVVAKKLIACNSRQMVDLVISHGVDVQLTELTSIESGWHGLDALDANGGIPVGYQKCYEAVELPTDYMRVMIRLGADFRVGESSWHAVVKSNKCKVAEFLVTEAGVDIDFRQPHNGRTALIEACDMPACRLGTIKMLLRLGADINAVEHKCGTALMGAVARSRFYVVRLLILNGAAVNATDVLGRTALHIAGEVNSPEMPDIARLLVTHGADLHARDRVGRTPLHSLVQIGPSLHTGWMPKVSRVHPPEPTVGFRTRNRTTCVKTMSPTKLTMELLLESGIDPNATDVCGLTALHYISLHRSPSRFELIEQLVEHGGDLLLEDKQGKRPYDYFMDDETIDVWWLHRLVLHSEDKSNADK